MIIQYGADSLRYGSDALRYGDNATGAVQAHWSFEYADGSFYAWTGGADLTIDGRTYLGIGAIARLTSMPVEAGEPEKRATITLSAIPPEQRQFWLREAVGPHDVIVRQLISRDGRSWQFIPRMFRGQLSSPRLQGGAYSVDIVYRIININRGRSVFWSHESQRRLYPGDDGFEHAATIADGVDIDWPPL